MKNQTNLILSQADFEKLSLLIDAVAPQGAELLQEELNRALVVPDQELPNDVVSMNSKFCYQDLESGRQSVATLVYPNEANIEENKISIFAPVGSALIGLRAGQVINWPVPNGKEKKLKVVSVLSQAGRAVV